jgi:NAD(P)-dependent dehydrogenase (short-subunit alcohol dehydrogenase family)
METLQGKVAVVTGGAPGIGLAMARRFRAEGTGVGVSVVCPGMVATGITVSDRNRPDHLRDEVRPATASSLPSLEAMESSDPVLVADAVVDAVRAGRFWVLTHPEVIELVEQRHRGLTDAARSTG